MSPKFKRRRSGSDPSLSPPPLRRRFKLDNPQESQAKAVDVGEHNVVFYSWNVNSIIPLLQKKISLSASAQSTYPLRTFLKAHRWPHFLCLQEVKINRRDEVTQRRVELAANAGGKPDEPTYTTYFSLPRDDHNAKGFGGQVYGVATFVRDDVPSLVVSTTAPEWDLEGRVLLHEFESLPLVLINGYWVNGTSNPHRDPDSGEVDGDRHDHKLRFHAHMLNLCKSIEAQGKAVLLVGDMNVAPCRIDGHPNLRNSPIQHVKNRADFNSKFLDAENEDGLRGIDVFRRIHKEEKKFTYHGRFLPWGENCDRVDLVIASRHFFDAPDLVTGTDICDTPAERADSDHVPIWVSIDLSKLRDTIQKGSSVVQTRKASGNPLA